MFAGMDFCPHCGARAARVVDEAGAPIPCPGCRGDMRPVQIGSTPMYECASCASVWLNGGIFTQLCLDRQERGAVAAFIDVGVTTSNVQATTGGRVRYVPCPQCRKLMNRENFGRRSGVVIDICKPHGVWFERGELHSVIAFIESGAFEVARKAEEKRKEDERQVLLKQFEASGHSLSLSRSIDIQIRVNKSGVLNTGGPPESELAQALRMLFS
jgi:Zn-finger nucleic acid-binding protein